jgi:hypothetical protein
MNNERTVDNKVFMNAVTGVVLLLITIILGIAGASQAHSPLSSLAIPAATGLSSIALLYAAIKSDKRLQAYSNMTQA